MMHFVIGFFVLLYSFCALCMTITKSGTQKMVSGPAENFTGTVMVTPLFQAVEPARTSGASVTFSPSARSNWHTHPMGQTLIVTRGEGRIQAAGEPIHVIKAGDVIWTPPGQKHWHGASPTSELTHIAIQEIKDGKAVEWLERVTDDQYNKIK